MFEREPLVGTMTAQVAKIIGMRVVGGEFLPGDVLPVEGDLCSAYGVSRTTVREAIKQLSSKRLIDVSPKIGTRVLPFADWNLLDRDVLAWRLHAQFDTKIIEDIFEMRLCFEPRACFLAAQAGNAADMQLLDSRYHALAAAYTTNEVRAAAEADLAFHMTIIEVSRNGMFITIGNGIKAALRVSSETLLRHATRPSEDLDLHAAVHRHILAHEPDAAAKAMTDLLTASQARLLPYTVKP